MAEVSQIEWFVRRLADLRDLRALSKVLARIERLIGGNPVDVKPVGAGVSELRINYGPGYRVYDLQRGTALIILLPAETRAHMPRTLIGPFCWQRT